jgi:hypothetical protein
MSIFIFSNVFHKFQKSALKNLIFADRASEYTSIMKPTWCTFHSVYWESRASTCFKHYLLIFRRSCTNGTWLYPRNVPYEFSEAPPEDEKVMLEICRGLWYSINWMKSASRWLHNTDLQNCLCLNCSIAGRIVDGIMVKTYNMKIF